MPDPLNVVVVPGGNLTLVMKSDEEWKRQEACAKVLQARREANPDEDDASPVVPLGDLIDGDIRIQVDATHLMRISKPFRIFLDPKSCEGDELLRTGNVELFLDEDDPEAMSHLMNAIFGRLQSVPGAHSDMPLDLDVFVEACCIVDKYDFHEPLCLLLENWFRLFDSHSMPIAAPWHEDFFKSLCICYILQKKAHVRTHLQKLITDGVSMYPVEIMPLPKELSWVQEKRVHAFGTINALLEKIARSARSESTEHFCTCADPEIARRCDENVLKTIVKKFQRLSITSPGYVVPAGGPKRRITTAQLQTPRLAHSCIGFDEAYHNLRNLGLTSTCRTEVVRKNQIEEANRTLRRAQEVCEAVSRNVRSNQFPYLPLPSMVDPTELDCQFQEATGTDTTFEQMTCNSFPDGSNIFNDTGFGIYDNTPNALGYKLIADASGTWMWYMPPSAMPSLFGPDNELTVNNPQGHYIPVTSAHISQLGLPSPPTPTPRKATGRRGGSRANNVSTASTTQFPPTTIPATPGPIWPAPGFSWDDFAPEPGTFNSTVLLPQPEIETPSYEPLVACKGPQVVLKETLDAVRAKLIDLETPWEVIKID